jgi:hypothetical protein
MRRTTDRLPVVAVDGYLRDGTGRQPEARHVVGQINTNHGTPSGFAAVFWVEQV